MTVSFKEKILEYSESLNREFNFIQIGCNDGFMADPISQIVYEQRWQNGIFIDADNFYLERAMALYGNNCPDLNLRFVHAGIVTHEQSKRMGFNRKKFFSINPHVLVPSRIPEDPNAEGDVFWAFGDKLVGLDTEGKDKSLVGKPADSPLDYLQGVGSFDYDFVLTHLKRVTEKQDLSGEVARNIFGTDPLEHRKFIAMNIIPTATINDVFSVADFDTIDLLQTDMETWDVQVMLELEQFNRKPKFIHFEAPGTYGGVSEDLKSVFEKCGYSLNFTSDSRDYLAELL